MLKEEDKEETELNGEDQQEGREGVREDTGRGKEREEEEEKENKGM